MLDSNFIFSIVLLALGCLVKGALTELGKYIYRKIMEKLKKWSEKL